MKNLLMITGACILFTSCTTIETRNNKPIPEIPSNVLTIERLDEIIKKNKNQYQNCANKILLNGDKSLPKNSIITIRMIISGNGIVKKAWKESASYKNSDLDSCAIKYISSLKFPPTLNGNELDLSYPMPIKSN